MNHLTSGVRTSVITENWYAALGLALALPDICGWLEAPTTGSKDRYVRWCERYLTPRYTQVIGGSMEPHVFLHGEDCYALRCAFLHEGGDDVTQQRARRALERFRFMAPPQGGGRIHCNQSDQHLQLQIDVFCEDVCSGVEGWQAAVENTPDRKGPSANESATPDRTLGRRDGVLSRDAIFLGWKEQ